MFRPLLLLAVAAAPLTACGDTFVDPFLRDSSALSVYGVLEAGYANEPSMDQTVRVQSVRTRAEPPTDPSDPTLAYRATVTSLDTFTGDSLQWTRNRTQFSDGTYGDLFSADFRPRPGGTYTLIIRRDDGREAIVDVTLPQRPEPTVLDWELRGLRRQVTERVAWETLNLDDASALVEMECGRNCGADIRFEDLEIEDLGDGRFAAGINLTEAQRLGCIENSPPEPVPCPPLTLTRVSVEARVLGPEWERAQDPTQTTVQNGYGFVGGATRVRIDYLPTREAAVAAGFEGTVGG